MNIRDRIVARQQRAQAIVDEMAVLLGELDVNADMSVYRAAPAVAVANAEPEPAPQPAKPKQETPRPQAAAPSKGGVFNRASDAKVLQVARAMLAQGPLTLSQIVTATGVSRATATGAIRSRPDLFQKTGENLFDPWDLTPAGRAAASGSSPATG